MQEVQTMKFIGDQNDSPKLVEMSHPKKDYELIIWEESVSFYLANGFQIKDKTAETLAQRLPDKERSELSDSSKIFDVLENNIIFAKASVSKLLNPILNFVRKKGE